MLPEVRDLELGRPGVGHRHEDRVVNRGLDRQQEGPRGRRELEEHRIQPSERRRRGEDAELEQEVVRGQARSLAGAFQEREEPLVRVRLAQRVLGLVGRDLLRDARAVLGVEVVAERGEDEAVHGRVILGDPGSPAHRIRTPPFTSSVAPVM